MGSFRRSIVIVIVGIVLAGCSATVPDAAPTASPTPAPAQPAMLTPEPTLTPTTLADGQAVLAFVCSIENVAQICLVNADGTDFAQVTDTPTDSLWPTWSPDGERIAFSYHGDIYVINTDGSDLRRLTWSPEHEYAPTWSPDGRRIVFVLAGIRQENIYIINATDGSGHILLTRDNQWGLNRFPAWSPDGSRIVFTSMREGDQFEQIYTMTPDGSDVIRLTNAPMNHYTPSWSPDGARIAFGGELGSNMRVSNVEIYVMNADGTNRVRLTDHPATDWGPVWSPDGRRIAFESDRDGDHLGEIYLMYADGSGLFQLVVGAAGVGYPAWRP